MGFIKILFGLVLMGMGGWILVKYSFPTLFLFFKISPASLFLGFPYINMYLQSLGIILLVMAVPIFLLSVGYSLIKD